MKINESICNVLESHKEMPKVKLLTWSVGLSTSKVLLVPYCKHHVLQYHEWMQDPDLLNATASEPLSLEEEYEMQRCWTTDHDKLTFIVNLPLADQDQLKGIETRKSDSSERMLGDINLFLFDETYDAPSPSSTNGEENTAISSKVVGEIELMIARKDLHHQGYGRAALVMFMHYVLFRWREISDEYRANTSKESSPELAYLRAKINESNHRSIRLFESVGFEHEPGGANYFGEVELRWKHDLGYVEDMKWFERPRMLAYDVKMAVRLHKTTGDEGTAASDTGSDQTRAVR